MKKILISLLLLVLLLGGIVSCKKKENKKEEIPEGNKMTSVLNAELDAVNTLYQYAADHQIENPWEALEAIVPILKTAEGVTDVTMYDNSSIVISLSSGLKCALNLQYEDVNGISKTRGGTSQSGQSLKRADQSTGPVSIKNKNILFYSPPFNDFYSSNEFSTLSDLATKSSTGATFTTVLGANCKPSSIRRFADYGLVMMSTHGFTYGFMCGMLNFDELYADSVKPNGVMTVVNRAARTEGELKQIIESVNEPGTYELLVDNRLLFAINISVKIGADYSKWYKQIKRITQHSCILVATSKYIESLPGFDNTVILANNCFSGASNSGLRDENGFLAIRDAMLMKSPGAYFGWVLSGNKSRAVENTDAMKAEKQFVTNMLYKLDTTGRASYDDAGQDLLKARASVNLAFTGENCALTLFGQENIWFGCGGPFTDPRDGNVYKTVCINNKQWMAENLRYNVPGSHVFNDNNALLPTYGRLYSVAQIMNGAQASDAVPSGVQGICPKGWHVPSGGEYDSMIMSVGGFSAGNKLKSIDLWTLPLGTNETGFNLLPAGSHSDKFGSVESGQFSYLRSSSTATGGSVDIGMYTYTFRSTDGVIKKIYFSVDKADGPWFMSCRCAKDY